MDQDCCREEGVARQTNRGLLREPGIGMDQSIAVAYTDFGGDPAVLPCFVYVHDQHVELA